MGTKKTDGQNGKLFCGRMNRVRAFTSKKNNWHTMKQKIWQRRRVTVEQPASVIEQEWDDIPLPKLQQRLSSLPRCLQTMVRGRGGGGDGKHGPVTTVWRCAPAMK